MKQHLVGQYAQEDGDQPQVFSLLSRDVEENVEDADVFTLLAVPTTVWLGRGRFGVPSTSMQVSRKQAQLEVDWEYHRLRLTSNGLNPTFVQDVSGLKNLRPISKGKQSNWMELKEAAVWLLKDEDGVLHHKFNFYLNPNRVKKAPPQGTEGLASLSSPLPSSAFTRSTPKFNAPTSRLSSPDSPTSRLSFSTSPAKCLPASFEKLPPSPTLPSSGSYESPASPYPTTAESSLTVSHDFRNMATAASRLTTQTQTQSPPPSPSADATKTQPKAVAPRTAHTSRQHRCRCCCCCRSPNKAPSSEPPTAEEVVHSLSVARRGRIRGMRCIVTGASSGIGGEVARVLFNHGAHVTMACLSVEKGEAASREMERAAKLFLHSSNEEERNRGDGDSPPPAKRPKKKTWRGEEVGPGQLEVRGLDLSRLRSVFGFCRRYLQSSARSKPLDLIVCCAGVMALPMRQQSEDGIEMQLAVNHVGHHYLVTLLKKQMEMFDGSQRREGARVVMVSSPSHAKTGIRWNDLHFSAAAYDKWKAYGQSKLANILFAMHYSVLSRANRQTPPKQSSLSTAPTLDANGLDNNGQYRRCKGRKGKGEQCQVSSKAINDGSKDRFREAARRLMTTMYCDFHKFQDLDPPASFPRRDVGLRRPPSLANSVDPGHCKDTALGRHLVRGKDFFPSHLPWRSVQQAAGPVIHAALAGEWNNVGGVYIGSDCQVGEVKRKVTADDAERLWGETESMITTALDD